MKSSIKEFINIVSTHSHIVFFGGAGVSTESGIPDFRSVDGLYYQEYKYPPETILSHTFYKEKKEEFFEFYKQKMIFTNMKPNTTHYALAALERSGKLDAIITQNIDGLHQKAGSKKVFELHGSILRNYCENCHASYSMDYIFSSISIPLCIHCNHPIKPDVVLYEESLNENIIKKSIHAIANAQVLIIAGTSLTVYPAASFINYFAGSHLIIINKTSTPSDNKATLVIHDSLGNVFQHI